MRRRSAHAIFGALALLCAAVAAVDGVRLLRAMRINDAIAAVRVGQSGAATPAASSAADGGAAPESASRAPREVQLARATALGQAGAYDAAFKAYTELIAPGTVDDVGRHALYNFSNMLLRQALGHASGATAPPTDAQPLVELAKQRLRDLLRADPADWDARYNLERALRWAPEEEEPVVENANVPVERRPLRLQGMKPVELP